LLLLSPVALLGGPVGNSGVVYGDCCARPFCDVDRLEPSVELSFYSMMRSGELGAN